MLLSEFKKELKNLSRLYFELPGGELVPSHFHVTEVGSIRKNFIDCGGVIRNERKVSFQLWEADDYDHQLHPEKLMQIISIAEDKLNLRDAEIEVEYQGQSINKYRLDFDGEKFLLLNTQTDCLAKDNCGVPASKPKVKLANVSEQQCSPNSGYC
ncbi:DUF6428 family protein [uncultured Christiangramia sp.]|uniref:DUF6428 family protein n=1 Tax=uncultured Christiangramia sp. TaxID=503836 RepID=UPI0026194EAC|nr:DUF6428 family protein [uncultured Christiangramia sp.]